MERIGSPGLERIGLARNEPDWIGRTEKDRQRIDKQEWEWKGSSGVDWIGSTGKRTERQEALGMARNEPDRRPADGQDCML